MSKFFNQTSLVCILALLVIGSAGRAEAIGISLPGNKAVAPTCSVNDGFDIDISRFCKIYSSNTGSLNCSPKISELRHAYAIGSTCHCEMFAVDESPTCGYGSAGNFSVSTCFEQTHASCRTICKDAVEQLNSTGSSICNASTNLQPAPVLTFD